MVSGNRYRIEIGEYVLRPILRTVIPKQCRDGKVFHDVQFFRIRKVPPDRQFIEMFQDWDS